MSSILKVSEIQDPTNGKTVRCRLVLLVLSAKAHLLVLVCRLEMVQIKSLPIRHMKHLSVHMKVLTQGTLTHTVVGVIATTITQYQLVVVVTGCCILGWS